MPISRTASVNPCRLDTVFGSEFKVKGTPRAMSTIGRYNPKEAVTCLRIPRYGKSVSKAMRTAARRTGQDAAVALAVSWGAVHCGSRLQGALLFVRRQLRKKLLHRLHLEIGPIEGGTRTDARRFLESHRCVEGNGKKRRRHAYPCDPLGA